MSKLHVCPYCRWQTPHGFTRYILLYYILSHHRLYRYERLVAFTWLPRFRYIHTYYIVASITRVHEWQVSFHKRSSRFCHLVQQNNEYKKHCYDAGPYGLLSTSVEQDGLCTINNNNDYIMIIVWFLKLKKKKSHTCIHYTVWCICVVLLKTWRRQTPFCRWSAKMSEKLSKIATPLSFCIILSRRTPVLYNGIK